MIDYQTKTKEELINELQQLQKKYNLLEEFCKIKDDKIKQENDFLLQTHENYVAFFNTIDDFLFVLDEQANIIHTNNTVLNRLGYTKEELYGNSVLMVHPPERRAEAATIVGEMLQGKAEYCPVPVVTKSNKRIPVETRVKPGTWNNQPVIFGVTKDISRLQLSEEKFSKVFYLNPSACGFSDLETGKYVEVNEAFQKLFGFQVDEVIGKTAIELDIFTKDARDIIASKANSDGNITNEQASLKAKNGDIKNVLLSSENIYVQNKKYRFTVANDITKIKQIEKELEIAKKRAEENDRLKSAFLANMSHEIRTPMNGILGFSSLLKEPGLSGENQRKFIALIEKSGARMLNTIQEIIDISKIESGQMKVNSIETNINEKVEYVYNLLKLDAEQKRIQLSYKNSLPNSKVIIKTDREKLYGILTNLVKNAIKYTEKGSVEFGYNLKGNFVEFYVKDTGIGIPRDRQKAIFERFIQADIADIEARQGAGLGLSITKAFVEMLGGKIWVVSETGIGSIFYFTLPYNAESEKKNELENIVPLEDEGSLNNPRGLKILIAEDDETSEILISTVVKEFSREVLKARTGNEAVEICRKNPDIDLILMDIQMPEMNGYNATKQIRQFNKDVLIIAQTAFGLSGDREKSIEAGCNDYISKPINKDELLALVKGYIKK